MIDAAAQETSLQTRAEKPGGLVAMGAMNGPEDKHPKSIIAVCYFLGKPLPVDAVCGNPPSCYLGENALSGKLYEIKKLLGKKMPDIPKDKLETYFKKFRDKFKKQAHMTYTPTDLSVYFCDWLLFARNRGMEHGEYFCYELYNKEMDVRDTFLNKGYHRYIYRLCNNREASLEMGGKVKFNTIFSEYVKRGWLDASTCTFEEFEQFIRSREQFFAKPIRGEGGRGARVIESNSDAPENLFAVCQEEKLILEDIIRQIPEVAEFNESTLNTTRLVTLLCADGNARVVAASGRFGRSGLCVDNFHAGGVAVTINVDTGEIQSDAINENLEKMAVHPSSGKPFKGFRYPFWEQMKAAVCEAATKLPEIRHLAWDVVVNVNGDVELVEANDYPSFSLLQAADQIGRRANYEPLLRELAKFKGAAYPERLPVVIDITGMEKDAADFRPPERSAGSLNGLLSSAKAVIKAVKSGMVDEAESGSTKER